MSATKQKDIMRENVGVSDREIPYIIIALMVISFIISVNYIETDRDFWHDEAFQYLHSSKSVAEILEPNDVHPPLFNLFAKIILTITDSIMGVRVAMAILFSILVAVVFFVSRKMFDNITALFSSLLLMTSPTFLHYATEFRSYTFTLILTTLQVYLFYKIIFKGSQKKSDSVWFIIFSFLMVASHYLTGLLIVAQAIFFIMFKNNFKEKVEKNYYHILVWLSFCLYPLVAYAFVTIIKIESFWFKDIDFVSLISTFYYILAIPNDIHFLIYPIIFYILLILFFVIALKRKEIKPVHYFCISLIILPVLLMFLISQVFAFYHHRYFLFGGIFLFFLMGNVIHLFSKQNFMKGFVITIFFFLMLNVEYGYIIDNQKYEIGDSVKFLQNSTYLENNPIFIHKSTFSMTPMKIYLKDYEHYIVTNLTRKQLFSAGGEAINYENEYYNDWVFSKEYDNIIYITGGKQYGKEKYNEIYDKGGLYIYQKEN